MTLTEHRKSENGERYELFVTFDHDEFEKEVERTYHKQKNKLNIQGFRKGKAPRSVIEGMFGKNFFYDDALNEMLPDALEQAVEQADVRIIGRPEAEVVSIDDKDGVKLKFSVILRPELSVKKYKGLKASRHIHTIEDSDVDAEIDKLKEKTSRMVEVTDRAAEPGDTVTIDFEGFVNDKAFDGGKAEGYELELGSGQFIAGFEDQIVGKKIGDEFDVNVTFPEDYGSENLSGKDAVFKVKLSEIRVKELPEINDEFAKDVSEFDTLKELRADLRKNLEQHNEEHADSHLREDVAEALASELEGDVPDVMIDSAVDEMVNDFNYRLSGQGLDIATYLQYVGQDMESLRKSYEKQAETQVKVRLALEDVARKEKIEVTEQDLEDEYKTMAENYDMELDKVKEYVMEDGLKRELVMTKALDVVVDNAKITEDRHSAAEHDKKEAEKSKAKSGKSKEKAEKEEK